MQHSENKKPSGSLQNTVSASKFISIAPFAQTAIFLSIAVWLLGFFYFFLPFFQTSIRLDCCEFCDFGQTPKNCCQDFIGVFPKIGVPQNSWFTMENPIKMDDLGVPPFSETSINPFPDHTLPVMLRFHSLQAGVCMIRFHVDSKKIGAFELSVFPYLTTIYYSWWLNQRNWKILVKLNHFPNCRAKNQKCLKPPARFETNLFPAPEKKLFWFTRILWWLAPKRQHFGREVLMISAYSATASHQTSSKHSRSRTPRPPRGGKASSKDPDQWNNKWIKIEETKNNIELWRQWWESHGKKPFA